MNRVRPFFLLGFVATGMVVAVTAQTVAYLSTGADRRQALHLTDAVRQAHTPRVVWLPDDAHQGRPMDQMSRQQLTDDYLRAWYQWQLSYLAGKPVGLKEYLTNEAYPTVVQPIRALARQALQLHQTDTDHHLQLHFVSADGQLVSFTDRRVCLRQRLYPVETGAERLRDELVADFAVVMVLDDGYWRIRHLVQQPPSVVPVAPLRPSAEAFVRVHRGQLWAEGHAFVPVGVNYYPQQTPWALFGAGFRADVVRADFARMRSLGLNTVRMFVPYADFGRGRVPARSLTQLKTLLDLAHRQRLKVIVTLFDFLGDYRLLNLTGTDRQLEQLLTTFRNHPALLAWDLKNEPDLDYQHHDPADVRDWLSWLLSRARSYDPNHLLTIGWAYPENAPFLADQVDFVSFHDYKDPAQLGERIDSLRRRVGRKPLLLEEFGQSTYRGLWAPFGHSEANQAAYYRQVLAVLNRKGVIGRLAWTLYDFDTVPAAVVGRKPWVRQVQKGFGLLRANGQPKPAAAVLTKPYFPTIPTDQP